MDLAVANPLSILLPLASLQGEKSQGGQSAVDLPAEGTAMLFGEITSTIENNAWLASPLTWGVVCGAVALLLMMPRGSQIQRLIGGVIGLVGIGLLLAGLLLNSGMIDSGDRGWLSQGLFWLLAGVTVMSAAAAVSMRSAVYSALWFAMSLLGTGSLLLFQGASFVGVATVVVYAGAIVVTFLFVIMLAQPEGHATYDRLTWGWYSKPASVLAAALLVAMLTIAIAGLSQAGPVESVASDATVERTDGVLHNEHMARLGAELFSRHLVSVEVAGTLLLVAMVGAVAIMVQGRQTMESETLAESNGTGEAKGPNNSEGNAG